MEMLLLPQPECMTYKDGEMLLHREVLIQTEEKPAYHTHFCAKLLQEEIREATGLLLEITGSKEIQKQVIRYQYDARMGEQQYALSVSEEGVILNASGKAGFLYATQTLRQIIRQCGTVLPVLEITDQPCVSVRGFYHDVTRGRVPTLESLKKLVDLCAFYKLNQLQLYVEHSYLFKELGGLFADRDPLTESDIRELDLYCIERGIELVPSLSSFGHLYELLRTKQYAHLCELETDPDEPFSLYDRLAHHTLDVSNPESEALVRRLITEYAALFTSDKFNICSDETFDLGKGKNKERAEHEGGTTRLYMDFLLKLCGIVRDCGKIPMFWGDILQEFPEKSSLLPEGTICLYWNYEPNATDEKLKGLVDAGIGNLYVCPGVHGWNHLINRYDHAYDNIAAICQFAGVYRAKGVLVTDWGDYGHVNHPDFSVPGLIYGAAFSWQKELLSKAETDRRISLLEYGDAEGAAMECINALSIGEDVTWGQLVCKKENRNWDQFVPSKDPDRNTCLEAAIQNGYRLLSRLPESRRERFAAYLLAAEGQVLFNRIWNMLEKQEINLETVPKEYVELAKKLRMWYRDYQKLWRRVSRESELSRIGEVVFWYSDRIS